MALVMRYNPATCANNFRALKIIVGPSCHKLSSLIERTFKFIEAVACLGHLILTQDQTFSSNLKTMSLVPENTLC